MDEVWALIEINDDKNKACEWLDDCFSLLSESFFRFKFSQELKSLFFWIKKIFTWERDDDLLDDFEKFDRVNILLEFFYEFSVKIESNFALDLGVEQKGKNSYW